MSARTAQRRPSNKALLSRDLGKVLAISGDFDSACRKYERALQELEGEAADQRSDSWVLAAGSCHLDLASCLLGLQRWQECVEHCNQAEELAGGDAAVKAKALFRRGQALAGLGKKTEAAQDIQAAVDLAPATDVWRGFMEEELRRVLGTPVGAAPGGEQAAQQGQQAAATVVEPPLPPALDPLLSWQIDRADIKLLRKMAGGGFGQVYLAEWHMTHVAAKVLNVDELEGESPEVLANLRKEASLMASLHHPNIVSFLGFCLHPAMIIMELCGKDSLTAVLDKAMKDPERAAELTWQRRVKMLLDAAKGMLYLHRHNPPVLHRDLKSPNILVSDNWKCQLADFNLSRLVEIHTSASVMSSAKNSMLNINPRWLAPEILMGEKATTKSDVFAFGLVMWEMMTWTIPWPQFRFPVQIIGCLMGGKRPDIPARSAMPGPDNDKFEKLEDYIALMKRCWSEAPDGRPAFEVIITELLPMVPQ